MGKGTEQVNSPGLRSLGTPVWATPCRFHSTDSKSQASPSGSHATTAHTYRQMQVAAGASRPFFEPENLARGLECAPRPGAHAVEATGREPLAVVQLRFAEQSCRIREAQKWGQDPRCSLGQGGYSPKRAAATAQLFHTHLVLGRR